MRCFTVRRPRLSTFPAGATAEPQALADFQARYLQAKYFQAEDLVLRAIQTEYGAAVKRQVTAGNDMGFDAAFSSNGRLNIVEVKYVGVARSLSHLRIARTTNSGD